MERDFVAGDFVSYWRAQKYVRGNRLVGGRWFGTAVVMGKIGRNVLAFHRQSLFKVSPEHLRHASESERMVAQSAARKFLGISNQVAEGKNLLGHQCADLANQSGPPSEADVAASFENVVNAPDHWEQRGNLFVRIRNTLRVGKYIPDPNDPWLQGVELDDWRSTRIKDSSFECQDKPWSVDQGTCAAPLRRQPWLGETIFRKVSVTNDHEENPDILEDVNLDDDSGYAPSVAPDGVLRNQ